MRDPLQTTLLHHHRVRVLPTGMISPPTHFADSIEPSASPASNSSSSTGMSINSIAPAAVAPYASIEEGMTWMDKELPEKQDMGEVKQVIRSKFEDIFGVKLVDSRPSESASHSHSKKMKFKTVSNSIVFAYLSSGWWVWWH